MCSEIVSLSEEEMETGSTRNRITATMPKTTGKYCDQADAEVDKSESRHTSASLYCC